MESYHSRKISALEKNKTCELTELPPGKRQVGYKWVFTTKYNSDGSLNRYNTIRLLLSLASNLDWPLYQLNVKNVFLNGDLEEKVYMDIPPPGLELEDKSQKVYRLKMTLYGLKQSSKT